MKKYLDITKRRIMANKFCQFLGTSLYRRSTVKQKEKKTAKFTCSQFSGQVTASLACTFSKLAALKS